MQKKIAPKGIISLCLMLTLSVTKLSAQQISASPQNVIRPVGPNTVSVFLDKISDGWGASGTYVWSVSPNVGVTFGSYSQSSPAADVTVVFSSAASGAYTFTLTRGSISGSVTVNVGNIAASSSSGNTISAFGLLNGSYSSGPGDIFSPVVQTEALGLSTNGYFYFLPNDCFSNNGNITVYAANPNGTGSTAIGSLDLNGSSNTNLYFSRLAIDPTGTGWILAGDNNVLYLAKFITNGINPVTITVIDPSVSLVNGNVSAFYDGDICFNGNGTLYALASNSNGSIAQVFAGTPNGTSTTLTKKWDLVNQYGNPFSCSASGIAFDALGSLYISTGTGLYYINQNTVNTATGTVQCVLVSNVTGLTDLASNLFPQQSSLPLRLLSFSGSYRNQKTSLRWETEAEVNFNHFEIERSSNGKDYATIGIAFSAGNGISRQNYEFMDDLSATSGTVFTYRLKIVDIDGQFKYSNVIMIRKETNNITGITINPNPVLNGLATIRFAATTAGNFDLRIFDVLGKLVLQQQNKAAEGINSISINGLDRLSAGVYVLHMSNDNEAQSAKLIITR